MVFLRFLLPAASLLLFFSLRLLVKFPQLWVRSFLIFKIIKPNLHIDETQRVVWKNSHTCKLLKSLNIQIDETHNCHKVSKTKTSWVSSWSLLPSVGHGQFKLDHAGPQVKQIDGLGGDISSDLYRPQSQDEIVEFFFFVALSYESNLQLGCFWWKISTSSLKTFFYKFCAYFCKSHVQTWELRFSQIYMIEG